MKFPQWWGLWQVVRARMRGDSSAFCFLRKVGRPGPTSWRAYNFDYLVSGRSSPPL